MINTRRPPLAGRGPDSVTAQPGGRSAEPVAQVIPGAVAITRIVAAKVKVIKKTVQTRGGTAALTLALGPMHPAADLSLIHI